MAGIKDKILALKEKKISVSNLSESRVAITEADRGSVYCLITEVGDDYFTIQRFSHENKPIGGPVTHAIRFISIIMIN